MLVGRKTSDGSCRALAPGMTSRTLLRVFGAAVTSALAAQGTTACLTANGDGSCPTVDGGIVVLDGGFPDGAFPTTDGGAAAAPSADLCAAACAPLEPDEFFQCTFTTTSGGEPAVSCPGFEVPCHTGRRPAGLRTDVRAQRGLADYFVAAAQLEAASVAAFRVLAAELRAHGAPRSLQRRALRSARDEVRHARSMAAFARRAGAAPRRVRVERR